jgi:hypothetical protein
LCADFTKFGAGQRLEDDANLLVHYKGDARGIMHCSKISTGEENRLNIRAYGTHASLEWDQEHPNELIVKYPNASRRTLRRGNDYVSDIAKRVTRLDDLHTFDGVIVAGKRRTGCLKALPAPFPASFVGSDIADPWRIRRIGIQARGQKTTIIWTRQPGPKWSERRLLVSPPETKISSSLLAR